MEWGKYTGSQREVIAAVPYKPDPRIIAVPPDQLATNWFTEAAYDQTKIIFQAVNLRGLELAA